MSPALAFYLGAVFGAVVGGGFAFALYSRKLNRVGDEALAWYIKAVPDPVARAEELAREHPTEDAYAMAEREIPDRGRVSP